MSNGVRWRAGAFFRLNWHEGLPSLYGMKVANWTKGLLLAVTLAGAGCVEKSAPAGAGGGGGSGSPAAANSAGDAAANGAASRPASAWPPTQAQPKLRTLKLYLGSEVITSELAMSQVEVGTGMMFRTTMAEDEGMLFIFGAPHRTSFYMRNTKVPLTAAYIDPQGTILELVELEPLNETPVEAKTDNVQYVLEMKQGWFKRHNIGVGSVVSTERGSLPKTFGIGN